MPQVVIFATKILRYRKVQNKSRVFYFFFAIFSAAYIEQIFGVSYFFKDFLAIF